MSNGWQARASGNCNIKGTHPLSQGPKSNSVHSMTASEANRLRSRALRHDLVALLDEAEGQGFQANVADLRVIAELLREPHLNHQFRYGGAEEILMPNLEATLQALYDLCGQLQGPIEEALVAEA